MKKYLLLFILLSSNLLFASSAYERGKTALQSEKYFEALKYFYISARHYNPNAYTELGLMYERGIGTEANPTTAFYWYQKAAKSNHPVAQYYLAKLYEDGKGTAKNSKVAYSWYQKAARNGSKDAQIKLASQTKSMQSEEKKEGDSIWDSMKVWQDDDKQKAEVKLVAKEPAEKIRLASESSTKENTLPKEDSSMWDSMKFWGDKDEVSQENASKEEMKTVESVSTPATKKEVIQEELVTEVEQPKKKLTAAEILAGDKEW